MATFSRALGRRVDRQVLRLQGRLDSANSDRFMPWILAIGVFTMHAALHAARVRSLVASSGQAPWMQAAWRRANGGAGLPMAGDDPASGSIIAEPILMAARYIDPTTLFVVLQAAALAITVVPLWRLARREAHLRVGATTVVVIAFALAPALHRANLGAFHPELLALPALVAAFLRALQERWVSYTVLVAFVLSCRADLGLTVAVLGVVLVTTGRRTPGMASVLAGSAWSVATLMVLDPQKPGGLLTPAGEYVARSTGPLGAIGDVLTQPHSVAQTLVSEPSIDFLIIVLAPLLFLPLVAPRRLVIAVPCMVLAVSADAAVQDAAGRGVLDLAPTAAHIAPALAFVFIALVYALERMGERSVTRINVDRRVLISLLAGVVLLFVAQSPTSPYRQPWAWGGRDATDGARLAVAAEVPTRVAVATSPSMSALLAERAVIVELPPDPAALTESRISAVADLVDEFVLDTSNVDTPEGSPLWSDANRERVFEHLEDQGFRTVSTVGPVHRFARSN